MLELAGPTDLVQQTQLMIPRFKRRTNALTFTNTQTQAEPAGCNDAIGVMDMDAEHLTPGVTSLPGYYGAIQATKVLHT